MKFLILATVASLALAIPRPDYGSSSGRSLDSDEDVPILKYDRHMEDDGRFSFDMETGNGISVSQSGAPEGPADAIVSQGAFSYISPEGQTIELRYVANGEGFQPEGDHLPVAPAFPHEIPEFVLLQIEKAAREDAARARGDFSSEENYPSRSYGIPQ